MRFSIHEVESREQRNSVTQASRKRVVAAASVKAWSVLQARKKRSEANWRYGMSATAVARRRENPQKDK
jgi:hypothetical protein